MMSSATGSMLLNNESKTFAVVIVLTLGLIVNIIFILYGRCLLLQSW